MRDVEYASKFCKAEFLQIGFSADVFRPDGPKRPNTREIIFCGNNYASGPNGRRDYPFPLSYEREFLVYELQRKFQSRFGVHGRNWLRSQDWLEEPDEAAAYRACSVAINSNHYVLPRFSSDRVFRAMGSEAFLVSNYYPDMEFTDGVHLVSYRSVHDIFDMITYWLDGRDAEKGKIAKAGCEFVHKNCTWDARLRELLSRIGFGSAATPMPAATAAPIVPAGSDVGYL
jgi:spore maturation protein CgeB